MDKNKIGLSIYIGDSSTDVLPALNVDLGIILLKSEHPSVLDFCKDFHIDLKPLYKCDRENYHKTEYIIFYYKEVYYIM